MNLTAPHPPTPATTTDTDHYAVVHNPAACTVCGLPVTHPIHTTGGTK